MDAVTELAVEAVGVEQGEEEMEVFLLAVKGVAVINSRCRVSFPSCSANWKESVFSNIDSRKWAASLLASSNTTRFHPAAHNFSRRSSFRAIWSSRTMICRYSSNELPLREVLSAADVKT